MDGVSSLLAKEHVIGCVKHHIQTKNCRVKPQCPLVIWGAWIFSTFSRTYQTTKSWHWVAISCWKCMSRRGKGRIKSEIFWVQLSLKIYNVLTYFDNIARCSRSHNCMWMRWRHLDRLRYSDTSRRHSHQCSLYKKKYMKPYHNIRIYISIKPTISTVTHSSESWDNLSVAGRQRSCASGVDYHNMYTNGEIHKESLSLKVKVQVLIAN